MDLYIKFDVLNKLLEARSAGIKLRGISEGTFELTYDPGALLPNVTIKLKKKTFASDRVSFEYKVEGSSSFMLSVANNFSLLPAGVEVNTDNGTITVIPEKLQFLEPFKLKRSFKYLNIHSDAIELGMVLV